MFISVQPGRSLGRPSSSLVTPGDDTSYDAGRNGHSNDVIYGFSSADPICRIGSIFYGEFSQIQDVPLFYGK